MSHRILPIAGAHRADILANAGGVVVSTQWCKSRAQFYWELDEVERRLEIYMRRAMELVSPKSKAYECPQGGPFIVAVERVAGADYEAWHLSLAEPPPAA